MRRHLVWMALAAAPSLAFAQQAPEAQPAAPAKPAPMADKGTKGKKDEASTVSGVTVNGSAPQIQTSIDRRSYSVSNDLQAQTGSIADALRNVPSVEVDTQGNVSLRGDPNVTILIDGKPSTQFQGDNKSMALQQLPANQIDRVEVITNPSAEFRADGSGGVINLVTKKAKGVGQTGSVRANTAGKDHDVLGFNIGYNSKTLSLTGDATLRHDRQKIILNEDRQRLVAGGFDDTTQKQVGHINVDFYGAHGGFDYDVTPKTRISGQARVNVVDFSLDTLSRFAAEDPLGAPTSAFNRATDIDFLRTNGNLSTSLLHKFAGTGHQLTLDLSYDVTKDDRVRDGQTTVFLPVAPDAFDQQRINNDLRQTELKGDYVRPMTGEVTLKAGFDLEYDDNSYGNRGFSGASPAALAPNAALTNLFLYKNTLSQAYVTYQRPFGDVTVLAGLRVENQRLDLTQVTQNLHSERDDTRLYPSLHLAWKLDDAQQLTASYSHRVSRPGAEAYNPFLFLVDPLNYRSGNPNLKPQETHSFELGYQLRKFPATFFQGTLYYRDNYNGIADVVTPLGGGVYLTTQDNIAKSRASGLELVAAGRLTKTVTYNVSSNVSWTELDSLGAGFAPTRSAYGISGRGNVNWQVTKDDLVQVNVFGIGKRLTPQGYGQPLFGLNLGYRRKLNDHVFLVVTAQDVLGSFKDKQVIDTPTLKTTTERAGSSRFVMVGLTWTFGGGKQKDPTFDYGGGSAPPVQ